MHDKGRDTALQCLVSDESAPDCLAAHPSTSRLCVCVEMGAPRPTGSQKTCV